jgi:mono/diheme cytochrome c family protein
VSKQALGSKVIFGARRAPRFFGAARWSVAAPLLLLAAAHQVHAQDALNGKRLYLDVGRLRGTGVSCVDCHGALPGELFGIGHAANDTAAVERAVNSISQMTPLRGRLTLQDYADLAAYIGNPAVPSPVLRTAVAVRDAAPSAADRVDFGSATVGQGSVAARIVFANAGALALTWSSSPRIVGPQAADFAIASSSCVDSSRWQAAHRARSALRSAQPRRCRACERWRCRSITTRCSGGRGAARYVRVERSRCAGQRG